MKITFIRHTSVDVPPGTCYGWSDVPLAPTFTEEARHVQKNLTGMDFDRVYTSPLTRCRRLAAYCGYPHAIPDSRLKEMNFGEWEMQAWEAIRDPHLQDWFEDWLHLPATGGESFEDQCRRVAAFLDEVRCLPARHIGVFTHRGTIACAQIYTGTIQPGDAFASDIPYGSTLTFDLSLIPPCRDGYCQNGK